MTAQSQGSDRGGLFVRLPLPLIARIEARAKADDRTMTATVRRLLESAFDHEDQARAVAAELATLRQAGTTLEA